MPAPNAGGQQWLNDRHAAVAVRTPARSMRSGGDGCPAVAGTVPIRLTQTPARCRVRPRAGIKVGIGRRLNTARDAEQRAEGVNG